MNEISFDRRVMIVTGEASGDLHGANLIRAFRRQAQDTEFFGVGGKEMAATGCEIILPIEQLSIMGIVEVISHLPRIFGIFKKLKAILYGPRKPDALVLIDSPEFNLRLAKEAARANVRVLYYVSPQVWAWRRGRVTKIAAVVDKLAAILPFEPELYKGLDIDVRYVGHPLLDEFGARDNSAALPACLQKKPGSIIVGLFPGSRRNELKYMLQTLSTAAGLIAAQKPDIHFLVPVATTLKHENVADGFAADLPVTFLSVEQAGIYDIAASCDAIITVSGTVTLQIALVGTPMAIIYKLAPLSYAIGKRLVHVDFISLVNIVAGKHVVREFVQNEATPENLAAEILRILDDSDYASAISDELAAVRKNLGEPGCSDRVAAMLLEMLEQQ
ncbi:MAG: lipid-A-disaccharide synthase [Deltaproteobacteria bacterium]|jgi:lipid-A-disaccharide synthase|nr:lipid-A-disaccharide synthase [Deltaproteobacteria bacterium]